MRLSKKEIAILAQALQKITEIRKGEKIRIHQRRKSQLRGKTISRITQKRKKYLVRRRVLKKRSSIR